MTVTGRQEALPCRLLHAESKLPQPDSSHHMRGRLEISYVCLIGRSLLIYLTHHDKIHEGDCIGIDAEYRHRAQHVHSDAAHCDQDNNSSPDVQTQEKDGH